MSEERLQLEVGKRAKYLREALNMDRMECSEFVSSLLNLGSALGTVFKNNHTEEN